MIDPNSSQAEQYINSMETVEYKEMLLADAEKKVREARNSLYVIAALTVAGGILFYFTDKISGLDTLIGSLIIALIFLALAAWVNKKPRIAVLTGLILYCGLLVIDVIAEPESIIRGLLVKGFIIYFLAKGFRAARDVEEMRATLGKIGTGDKTDIPLDMVG